MPSRRRDNWPAGRQWSSLADNDGQLAEWMWQTSQLRLRWFHFVFGDLTGRWVVFFCVGELACRRLGVSARCPRSTKKFSIFTDIAHQEEHRPISRAVSLTLSQTVDVVNTSRVFLMIIIFNRIASHVETKTSINRFGVYTGKSSMAITPLIKNAVENFQRKKTHSAGHRLIHQDYHVLNCSSLNVAVPDTKAKFRVTDKRFCRNVCWCHQFTSIPTGQNWPAFWKACRIWLDCSYPQQQLPEGLPFQQATVTVKFKMASKMAAAIVCVH